MTDAKTREEQTMTKTTQHTPTPTNEEKYAAHIACCITTHDELVRALRECLAELESYEQDRFQRDICDRARAALAKVEA